MLNIVIPMAGRGSRFASEGYKLPKPMIPVHGKAMIQCVVENLAPKTAHRFIFICQKQHVIDFDLDNFLKSISSNCIIVSTDEITEGAACSVLLAKEHINTSEPLMIANSDQWVDIDINDYLSDIEDKQLDGLIMTMTADDPKWSFVGFDDRGRVNLVVEKEVISDEATVGIYNFSKGSDFCYAVDQMISQNLRVNGEFYVAPAYNILLEERFNIGVYNIGAEMSGMYGLGIPADLTKFLSLPVSNKVKSV
jgi:NDP-sugar pyrophosphorylase family protein